MKQLFKCVCPLSGVRYEKELTLEQAKSLTEIKGRLILIHEDVLKKHAKTQNLTLSSYGIKKEKKPVKKPSRRKKKE
ncbi:MAG: hypothetical protein EBU90_29685 [Proteobacteria bacterium]|nr:hypothetical protein [Pseudomonadota bacterium]